MKEIRLRIRFSCASSLLLLTFQHIRDERTDIRVRGTRFHVLTVPRFRNVRRKLWWLNIDFHTILASNCLFFFQQFHQHDNVRSELISRNAVAHNVIFLTIRYSRALKRGERAKPNVRCVREQGLQEHESCCCLVAYYNRTDSHRGITPSLYLSQTANGLDYDRSVPPLRKFSIALEDDTGESYLGTRKDSLHSLENNVKKFDE